MSLRELRWLAAVATRCVNIIELGCFRGRSTRALAEHVLGRVFAVDHWRGDPGTPGGEDVYRSFLQNMRGLSEKLVVVKDSARDAFLGLSLQLPQGVDFVFIDDDHSMENVRNNIVMYIRLVRRGGIIAGHDYGVWPGVAQAVDAQLGKVNHVESIWWKTV